MVKPKQGCSNHQRNMDAGDLAPLVTEFMAHPRALGHSCLTVSNYEGSARHFACWLIRERRAVGNVDEDVVSRFARHRCRCPGIRRVKGVSEKYARRARRFVDFLGERGIVRCEPKSTSPAFDRHVIEFQEWLRRHRGITELTIGRHGRMVMRLPPALGRRSQSWDAQLIRDVILAETRRASLAYVKTMTMAPRGYLRFLGARGLCRAGLERAVPIIPQWRLSALPRYISTADVSRLIATCDRATPAGARDRAILFLLARLGLRAGDILALRLHDIDWQHATLPVRGKGRRETRLPFPQDAGDAVLDYLKRSRPCVARQELFLTSNAPFRALRLDRLKRCSTCGRQQWHRRPVERRQSASAFGCDGAAARRRHARHGRRRTASPSPDTTAHYAKVDIVMLQQIAQPWPGDA